MPDFHLTSEQLGTLADDGSIGKHPEHDVFGRPYDRVNASRKRVSKTQFVVIPTGKDHEDNVFIVPADKPAPKTKD